MSTYIKLSKAQISKKIQTGGSFDVYLGTLGKKVLRNVAIPFDIDNLPGLVSNITSDAILNAMNFKEKQVEKVL